MTLFARSRLQALDKARELLQGIKIVEERGNREIIMINDTCCREGLTTVAGEITLTSDSQKRIIGAKQVVRINELRAYEISRGCLGKYAPENGPKRKKFQEGNVPAKVVLKRGPKSTLSKPLRNKILTSVCIRTRFSLAVYIAIILPVLVSLTGKCWPELNQNQSPHLTIDHELQLGTRRQQQQQQKPSVIADSSIDSIIFGANPNYSNIQQTANEQQITSNDLNEESSLAKFAANENRPIQVSYERKVSGVPSSLDAQSNRLNFLSRRTRSQVSPSSLPGTPKLVQWAKEAVQYYEGSTLVLSCSLAMSIAQGNPLKFSWFKQGKQLSSSSISNNNNQNDNNLFSNLNNRLSIETLADYSFLRLADLRSSDSGAYTCVASNSFGQEDRTSTQVIVNVKLKWLAPSSNLDEKRHNLSSVGNGHELLTVKAGQFVSFECNAAAQPQPRIRWFKLGSPLYQAIEQTSATKASLSGPRSNRLHGEYGSQQTSNLITMSQRNEAKGDKLNGMNHFAKLDEAQIRSSLLQMDAVSNLGELLNRFEITSSSSQSKEVSSNNKINSNNNETKGWRIETMISGGGNGAQHELYSRLVLDKADINHSGIYECEVVAAEPTIHSANLVGSVSSVHNHHLQQQQQQQQQQQEQVGNIGIGDRLQKLFGLVINGK